MRKCNCKDRKMDAWTVLVMGIMAVMGAIGGFTLTCSLFDISIPEIGIANGIGIISGIAGCLFGVLLLRNCH